MWRDYNETCLFYRTDWFPPIGILHDVFRSVVQPVFFMVMPGITWHLAGTIRQPGPASLPSLGSSLKLVSRLHSPGSYKGRPQEVDLNSATLACSSSSSGVISASLWQCSITGSGRLSFSTHWFLQPVAWHYKRRVYWIKLRCTEPARTGRDIQRAWIFHVISSTTDSIISIQFEESSRKRERERDGIRLRKFHGRYLASEGRNCCT